MSNKKKNKNEEVVEVTLENIVVETEPDTIIEPVVEVVADPEPNIEPIYVITGCEKLNVRKAPSATADVVCVIDKKAEIVIIEDIYGVWVEVLVDGKHGYCMKKFIVLK